MKTIIVLFLLAIVVALFTAMFFMLKDDGRSKRTVWMLTLRVGLSVTLILFLIIAAWQGWISPHPALPPPR